MVGADLPPKLGVAPMNYMRSLAGTALVMLSSAVLASPHSSGHAHGGGHTAGAAASSTQGGSKAPDGGVVMTSGPLKGATITQDTVAGEPAVVAHLPPRSPLTAEERTKLHNAGYSEVTNDRATYYCRRVRAPSPSQSYVNDCLHFDVLEGAPKDSRARDNQQKEQKEAPRPPASRVEYG